MIRIITRCLLLWLLALCQVVAAQDAARSSPYNQRDDVQRFIASMVMQHNFSLNELEYVFSKARYQPMIVRAMAPAPTGQRSWQAYRARFLNQRRISEGAQFWLQHRSALARAADIYGVPEEIIVAIIGVETEYGRNTGGFRVIDALTTLAFDYPRRAEFFQSELEHFLLYARESNIDVLQIKGSYAGAVGIPQFMPGSYRRYAVDFDHDGRRDLYGSAVDAIGSVANYLRENGWERGQPIALPAQVQGLAAQLVLAAGVLPSIRVDELQDFGIAVVEPGELRQPIEASSLCALVELETPGQPSVY